MAIYKLKTGDRITFHVRGVVREVPANNPKYGPSHKFVGDAGDDADAAVFMSPASADRQLARHGLTLDTVVGRTIIFAKPGEYVDVELPSGADVPAPAKPAPASNAKQGFSSGPHVPGLDAPVEQGTAAPAQSTDDRLAKLFALYDRCLDHAALASKRLTKAEIPVTHEGVSAMTSTLFIQANQRGCL